MPILNEFDPRLHPPFVKKLCGARDITHKHTCGKAKGHPGAHVSLESNYTVAWGSDRANG